MELAAAIAVQLTPVAARPAAKALRGMSALQWLGWPKVGLHHTQGQWLLVLKERNKRNSLLHLAS